jgi:NADPH:quinone reductase-like Zn-dependent oxidoreductase
MTSSLDPTTPTPGTEDPGTSNPARATRRALTRTAYGHTDALAVTELPVPDPGPDQVLVRVRAAGLDRGVWHLMAGLPYLVRLAGYGLRAPKNPVLGADLAGVVEAVGSDVTRFAVGDEVVGIGEGTFATHALAPESKLAAKPASLEFERAAIVPISGLTALEAVRDVAKVQPGQRVLILGASGGVGTYATQIAKLFGAEVTGVCSTAKLDLVRSLGADHVVDYTTTDPVDGHEHYDVILDIGGNRPLRALRRALTPKGTLVVIGGEGGDRLTGGTHRQLRALLWSPFLGQRLTTFIGGEDGDDLAVLLEMIDRGDVTPVLDRTCDLDGAPAAIDDLVAGRIKGKIAVVVGA